MDKYRIYIDESGHANLDNANNPNERFLSLTGVIINLNYVNKFFHDDMENFKKGFFNYDYDDPPIVFHRKDILNGIGEFKILKDPKIRANFNLELLDRLKNWDYEVITVLIDKKEHKEKYKVWKYDPYHYCLEVLLERYLFILEERQAKLEDRQIKGDVMSESRNNTDDMRLKKAFTHIYRNGTSWVSANRFQSILTSRELKLKKKEANISGLQLADLIAHPSRNDLLISYRLKKKRECFGNKIVNILRKGKYHKVEGKLLGYGLKKLP